jgi:hypothetical protein
MAYIQQQVPNNLIQSQVIIHYFLLLSLDNLHLHFICYPLSQFPLLNLHPHHISPPPASMQVLFLPYRPHCPGIPNTVESSLYRTKTSPTTDARQCHPLLHMLHIRPCVLFARWFSPWELWGVWLADIVLPMGLQTPSAPSVLSLTPPSGTLCSVQWLAASICLCICQTLAEPLRRQLYQAPISKHFLASTIVSSLVTVYGIDPQVSQYLEGFSPVSVPHFVSIFPLMRIVFPLLRRTEASTLWSSFFLGFVVCELDLGYSKPLGYPLISEYIPCMFLYDWIISLRMIFSSSIHLLRDFMKSLFLIAE